MAQPDNLHFKSMCIFTYEYKNYVFTTVIYFQNTNYNIDVFYNSCLLVAKIINCYTLTFINNNERIIVELNKTIHTMEVSVYLIQQIQNAINRQLSTLII